MVAPVNLRLGDISIVLAARPADPSILLDPFLELVQLPWQTTWVMEALEETTKPDYLHWLD